MCSLEELLNAAPLHFGHWHGPWPRKPLKKKWLKHVIALAMDYLSKLLSISEEKSLCEWSESFTGLDSSQMIVDCPLNIDR